MKHKRTAIAICIALSGLIGSSTASAAVFGSDVPGDGVSVCLLFPACTSNFIGTASATAGGVLTGTLKQGGSTFGLQVGSTPFFIDFAGGTESTSGFNFVGPLGFNPLYTSISGNNVGMPISGQVIKLNVTNTAASTLTGLTFFLEIPQALVTSGFTPQADGISFGLFCPDLVNTCTSTPLALLATPTGPAGSTVNSSDITPLTSTFGDLLRFNNVNLAPGATGAFSFFVTDYKGTRAPNTNGSPASGTFNLEVVPSVSAVSTPEPGSIGLAAAGIALLAFRKLTRYRS